MRKLFTSLLLASASIASVSAATVTQPSIVEMQTNVGTVSVQLNWDKAPISSQNFLNYVNSSFYKNTFFHRIYSVYDPADKTKLLIRVVQGGGFDAKTMQLKTPLAAIVNEANNGLHNSIGTISMARTNEPNSATSQFFFNTTDNSANFDANTTTGNAGYAVFGAVIGGMDIVDKIGNFGTIKTAYSEGVPFSEVNDCGFNFCLKKVIIENVYTSQVADTINSWTRISINGSGRVTSSPVGLSCAAKCTLKKPFGTAITLNVKPSTGYQFAGWSGDCSGVTTSLALDTKTKNNNCTATFTKIGA
jgi:peptidyl-prolyl cis-trans isomerase A (cyclophilin A)